MKEPIISEQSRENSLGEQGQDARELEKRKEEHTGGRKLRIQGREADKQSWNGAREGLPPRKENEAMATQTEPRNTEAEKGEDRCSDIPISRASARFHPCCTTTIDVPPQRRHEEPLETRPEARSRGNENDGKREPEDPPS